MSAFDTLLQRGFEAFAFGWSTNLPRLHPTPLGVPLRRIAAEGPDALAFHQRLNRLNAWAFGGLGMPPWVQLDLGVLPSAFIGWTLPARDVEPDFRQAIAPDARDDERIPVAEALAVPHLEHGTWVTVSLASAIRGSGMGVATKAIALAAYRARRSIGICQYDQPALRVHTAFGKLRIVDASVVYHDHAPRTFVYAIDDVRRALVSMNEPFVPLPGTRAFDPHDAASIRQIQRTISEGGRVYVVPPGFDGERCWVVDEPPKGRRDNR